MQIGDIVMAVLPENKFRFGLLTNTEVYRVAGVVKGNNGEVVQVRLAGVRNYWPVDLFQKVPEEMLERLKEKATEVIEAAKEAGFGNPLSKSIKDAIGGQL